MDLVFHLTGPWTDGGEPTGIGGIVEFRTDVFDTETVETLIERLERVLLAITDDPGQRLSSADLLDADEHARALECHSHRFGRAPRLGRPTAPESAGVGTGWVKTARLPI